MDKKCAQPGVAERVPVYSVERRKLSERLRKPLALALAVAIGAPALAGAAGSANRTARLKGVGFADNIVWTEDQDIAKSEMNALVNTGANIIEIIEPYTQGGASVDNDLGRLCTAVTMANENKLDVLMRTEHRYRGDANLGYMPTTPTEMQQYYTSMYDLFSSLFGENGCAKGLKTLYLSPLNEPNYKLFDRNQYVNGRWVAPEDSVEFYKYEYSKLHAAAEEYGIDLKIVGGELNQNHARDFLKKMQEYMHKNNIKGPLVDVAGEHYYVQKYAPRNLRVAAGNMGRLIMETKKTFGNVPVWYTEVGAVTKVPATKMKYYSRLSKTIIPMPAEAQGEYYNNFLRLAACNGVERVVFWQRQDDGGPMRTGLDYADGTPKASKNMVTPNIVAATQESHFVC